VDRAVDDLVRGRAAVAGLAGLVVEIAPAALLRRQLVHLVLGDLDLVDRPSLGQLVRDLLRRSMRLNSGSDGFVASSDAT
jgi:hypothetical protein